MIRTWYSLRRFGADSIENARVLSLEASHTYRGYKKRVRERGWGG